MFGLLDMTSPSAGNSAFAPQGGRLGAIGSGPVDVVPVGAVDRLGKYRLIVRLARGGMGDVYLAVVQGPADFQKLLVVKELRHADADAVEADAYVAMFLDEAKLAARLNHPNIVQAIEVGSEGERHFFAMEYLEGQTLGRVLQRGRQSGTPLPVGLHLRVILDVLTALDYAHTLTEYDRSPLGIVHRDVSPQNVVVTYEGQVKLIDFGVAKMAGASSETKAGVVKGKIRYMAPEQVTGRPVDGRADVFAIGLMLWNMIAGSGPWEGLDDFAILSRLLAGDVPRFRDAAPSIDPAVIALIDRATHPSPDERPPSARALRDEVERLLAERVSPGTPRDCGSFVSSLFEEDRRTLRSVVDAQMRALQSDSAIKLVALGGARERDSAPTSSRIVPSTPPSIPVEVTVEPSRGPALGSWRRRSGRSAVWALAIVGVLASGVLALTRSSAGKESPAPATAIASVATPVRVRETQRRSHVQVQASPPQSRLYVDGRPVPNPYVADVDAEAGQHEVRAECAGYVARTLPLRIDADAVVELALEREPPPRREPPRAVPTVRAPIAETVPVASAKPLPASAGDVPASKPKRDLDEKNPYGP
jgi:eukaryotic-like serine/threonine-protein kinase